MGKFVTSEKNNLMKKNIQFLLIAIFQIIPIISIAQTAMPRQLVSLPEIGNVKKPHIMCPITNC